MRSTFILLACLAVGTGASASPTQQVWTKRETRAEAAANVRRLMKEETMGSIATVFPEETNHVGEPFAMLENMTIMSDISSDDSKALAKCYTQYHPDAKGWLPGAEDSPHYSVWARFDVHDIYYVGGFGE
ncbi:hypothetical protein QFC22_005760 [Naganishia vaughanmartiniae]|uniref:Uncharacterized protein n=1 Tax=Naganishia vaughanmartiniae TaxID=1424756 RepID=A0ACC2WRA8_9TREE|nr:hypothetical protein QFC22_005760 [Naganishia vaughanmartiniae]